MQITGKVGRLELFLSQDENNLNILAELTHLLLEAGLTDRASYYLEKGLHIAPGSPQFIYLSGLMASTRSDYKQAIDIYESLLVSGQKDSTLFYQAALCYLHVSLPQKALRLLTTASSLSKNKEVLFLLGRTQYQLGDFEQALLTLTTLAEEEPGYSPVYGLLSQIYLDYEDWDRAQAYANMALELDEGNNAANVSRGYIDIQSRQFQSAETHFKNALSTKEDSGRTHLGLAIVSIFQRHFTEAEQHLQRALIIQPDSLPVINLLGWLYILTDRFLQARTTFERGIEIDRRYGEMYGGLAVIDVIQGQDVAARQQVSRSLRLNKMSYAGNFAKILLLQNAKQLSQAEKVWRDLITSPVDDDGKTLEQAIIEQLRDYLKVTLH